MRQGTYVALVFAACLVHATSGVGFRQKRQLGGKIAMGRCKIPGILTNEDFTCTATYFEVGCTATCRSGYQFTTRLPKEEIICDKTTGEWFDLKNGNALLITPKFPNCDAVCVPACQNGGSCTAPNTCSCAPGYSGGHCQHPSMPLTSPSTAAPTPPLTTTVATTGPCTDTDDNCKDYGATICSNAPLSTWVDKHCRKFCNRC